MPSLSDGKLSYSRLCIIFISSWIDPICNMIIYLRIYYLASQDSRILHISDYIRISDLFRRRAKTLRTVASQLANNVSTFQQNLVYKFLTLFNNLGRTQRPEMSAKPKVIINLYDEILTTITKQGCLNIHPRPHVSLSVLIF